MVSSCDEMGSKAPWPLRPVVSFQRRPAVGCPGPTRLPGTSLSLSLCSLYWAFCCCEAGRFSSCLFVSRCSRKLAGPRGRKRIGWMEFCLFHYAGEVTYCTKGECPWGTGHSPEGVPWRNAAHPSQMFPSRPLPCHVSMPCEKPLFTYCMYYSLCVCIHFGVIHIPCILPTLCNSTVFSVFALRPCSYRHSPF